MDEETLLRHTVHWTEEPSQAERILSRLTKNERDLFEDLLNGRWGKRIRLEQERISIHCVEQFLLTL